MIETWFTDIVQSEIETGKYKFIRSAPRSDKCTICGEPHPKSKMVKFKKIYPGRTRYWVYMCQDCYDNAQILAKKYNVGVQKAMDYMRAFLSDGQKQYYDIDEYMQSQSGEIIEDKLERVSFKTIYNGATYYTVKELLKGFGIKLYIKQNSQNRQYYVESKNVDKVKEIIRGYYNSKARYTRNCVTEYVSANT